MLLRATSLCFLLFLSTTSLLAQLQLASVLEKIEQKLSALYDTIDFAGGIFAVVLPDDSYGAVPIGFANQEKRLPMHKEHLMLGGSTGKIFVSAVIMQLVQEGVLDLDQPVKEYLGNYN